ncbi:MAG: LPXTG cell wall anchor domain-containing protein [Marmoricola sp.]
MYGNHTSVAGVGVGVLPMTGAGHVLVPLVIGTMLVAVGSLLLLRNWILSSRDAHPA